MRSMSALLLSALHTETRLPVTLCVADCTRHGPTLNGDGRAAAGSAALDDPAGPGVDVLLPLVAVPMLYDWEMFVRAKKDEAAANMMGCQSQTGSPGLSA